MSSIRILLICLLLPVFTWGEDAVWPTLFRGRFRPSDASARLWLEDLAHKTRIDDRSAETLLWDLHANGTAPYADVPLFAIQRAKLKEVLGLPAKQSRFSPTEIEKGLERTSFLSLLARYAFLEAYQSASNRGAARTFELSSLAPGLWVALQGTDLMVLAVPKTAPWSRFQEGDLLCRAVDPQEGIDKGTRDEAQQLQVKWRSFTQFNSASSNLSLEQQGPHLLALPFRGEAGRWISLSALRQNASNFTPYADTDFTHIRNSYLKVIKALQAGQDAAEERRELGEALSTAYAGSLAGEVYQTAAGNVLRYPSMGQLKAERAYYSYPFTTGAWILYALGLLLFALGFKMRRWAIGAALAAFLLHSTVLALRVYILGRPPVSNMYETLLYVPWISVVLGGILYSRALLAASCAASLGMLLLLQLTHLDSGLENVQAVLDSQYWLTVHVLMVVGSYGVFLLAAVLGHAQLFQMARGKPGRGELNRLILHSLYVGTALLVTGTVLGGVWAAQSWGRFWDWDPKESWAFISSCAYLMGIHLYSFGQIREKGLAVCAALGFLVISFTWYGV
ncbi:MAG: cytochrome c biogenesis protein CcsA, partial [Chlamydiia bacterium]|nr:cytochrome c biogenesis protein CcsA [Chlamydiia bacterium]